MLSKDRANFCVRCNFEQIVMAAVQTARQVSRGELLSIANKAVKTYLAGLPKEVVETVDTALLVNDSVFPVHQLVLISSSAMLRDLLTSQASFSGNVEVQMIPLIDDQQDCVRDALAYIYRRMLLSIEPPKVEFISTAKHLVNFGHKYGIQVLLDEGDAFISTWCKTRFPKPRDGHMSSFKHRHVATAAAKEVVEGIDFAERAGLQLSLEVCASWFVQYIWDLQLRLEDQLTSILAEISSPVLARIMSAVAKNNCIYVDLGRRSHGLNRNWLGQ